MYMSSFSTSAIIGLTMCFGFLYFSETQVTEMQSDIDKQIALSLKKESFIEERIKESPPKIDSKAIKQIDCLAKNIYFEARSEPVYEQIAVGQVTLNRMNDERYSNSVCGVVFEPYQFSWTLKRNNVIREKEAWKKAVAIAKDLYYGKITKDYAKGATHFHRKDIRPSWSKSGYDKVALNSHIFMKVD